MGASTKQRKRRRRKSTPIPVFPPKRGKEQAAAPANAQCQKLMNPVMISALVKSMKNAPTSGATRNARGATP